MLREDVEDHGGAVDDFDLDDVLERAPLAGGELGIRDHRVGTDRQHEVAQLVGLAPAEVRRGVGMRTALQDAVEHDGSCRFCERGELLKRVLGLCSARPTDTRR